VPRIGIDARAAAEVPAGRGRYVRELTRALLCAGSDLRLYGRRAWPLPGSRWRLLPTPDPFWGAHAGLLAARECDVILASNSYLMAIAPAPTVPVVFDLFGFDRRHGLPASALAERATLPLAVSRAAGFICISETTRRELEERFPRTRGRTIAIPLGAGHEFFDARPRDVARRHGIDGRFVLAVGTLEPRKNLARLVEAFLSLPHSVRETATLALAGGRGWSSGELDALTRGHPEAVRVLGFVPDDELPSLYAEASVFAYPSLEEGFGLPVLEAMAAGTPVLTSSRSALREVGEGAALMVDPTDTDSIAGGLERLLSDGELRDQLAERGRERASAFTWERTARETLDFLIHAAG
jgi:glycosyltransferase involved in cell wall biosynthesis